MSTQPDFRRLLTEMAAQPDEGIDLALGALYIAGEEYPGLDVDHYMDRITALAWVVESRRRPGDDPFDTIARINDVLFEKEGFSGNEKDYYDPRNSFLNEVLDRKKGIPITLSVIYLEVARLLGLPFSGVGLPGHFIVKCEVRDADIFVDPFHRGLLLTAQDCRELVRQQSGGRMAFREEFLRPVPPRQVLVRMLTNLRLIYMRRGELPRAISAADRIVAVDPASEQHLLDRATVYYHAGRYLNAIKDLEEYLRRRPDAPDAEAIRHNISALWHRASTTN